VFVLMLPTVPETPRWLAAIGRWDDATATSKRLCATQADVDFQMSEIRESLAATANMTKVPFFTRGHRKVILLAVAIAVFNQLSGINAVLYYAPRVMQEAGASTNAAFLMSVGVGAMNLVATMVGLSLIDRLGRRKLMIVGSIGYLMSLGFLAAVMFYYENARDGEFTSTSSILVLIGLMGFIAAHAVGQGSVIWVFLSEIFPNRIRGQGQSLGSLTHWVFAAITSFAFPPIIGALGAGAAFSIFFLAMVGQLIWVLKVMPETKGVPLEEMEAKLGVALDHGPDQPTAVRAH
ncbi:MFS transporter, partial [Rhodococcus opacus]